MPDAQPAIRARVFPDADSGLCAVLLRGCYLADCVGLDHRTWRRQLQPDGRSQLWNLYGQNDGRAGLDQRHRLEVCGVDDWVAVSIRRASCSLDLE